MTKIGNNGNRAYAGKMLEPENNNPPRPKYKWPWFVLGFVVLGFVLAVIWVALAARKIEQQRDLNAPLPSTAPAR